jgi:hypothetical protein
MGDGLGAVSNSAQIVPREMVLTLRSFARGGGTLLDLELAAFGYHAGFAGAALALEIWAWQLSRSCLPQRSRGHRQSMLQTQTTSPSHRYLATLTRSS